MYRESSIYPSIHPSTHLVSQAELSPYRNLILNQIMLSVHRSGRNYQCDSCLKAKVTVKSMYLAFYYEHYEHTSDAQRMQRKIHAGCVVIK